MTYITRGCIAELKTSSPGLQFRTFIVAPTRLFVFDGCAADGDVSTNRFDQNFLSNDFCVSPVHNSLAQTTTRTSFR